MAESSAAVQPIILKRVKKAGHASHGGVWKLAYADFVTAMMAFFLLLWLLNSVTQEQLQGISNFFAPVTVSKSQSGSAQVLGGKTVGDPGAAESPTSRASVTQDLPPPKVGTGADAGEGSAEDDGRKAQEEEQFKEAEAELRKAVESVPALRQLANSLLVDNTPEGLRIQLVDQQGFPLFPVGSFEMYLHTRRLLEVVAKVILEMPQKISIAGHTDSTGYADETKYSNWELSSDRANAARRALAQLHIPKERVGLVSGKAYVDPLKADDPTHPTNRRLTVVLLRGTGDPTSVIKKPAAADPRRLQEALPGLDALRERQIKDESRPAPAPAPQAAPPAAAVPLPPATAPRDTLPGLDALRERQIKDESRPAPAPPPPPQAPAAPSAPAVTPPRPPAAAQPATPALPGLDAIRERQRREDAAKKQQK